MRCPLLRARIATNLCATEPFQFVAGQVPNGTISASNKPGTYEAGIDKLAKAMFGKR